MHKLTSEHLIRGAGLTKLHFTHILNMSRHLVAEGHAVLQVIMSLMSIIHNHIMTHFVIKVGEQLYTLPQIVEYLILKFLMMHIAC